MNFTLTGELRVASGIHEQEKTYEELKKTLEITLKEALEFNRQDALTAADNSTPLVELHVKLH